MVRHRRSTFPIDKPFEQQESTTKLSEVALRLVENFYGSEPRILGTATVLCGHLAVTAKHVFEEAWNAAPGMNHINVDKHLVALQLVPGPDYVAWDVNSITADPVADIALLHLGNNPGRSSERLGEWRAPIVSPFAPEANERVAAFGYRNSTINVSKNADGGNHIEINDEPMVSVGIVREVFTWQRDRQLCWPCYQVSARFDGGMSGGPVYDEFGHLCGLVCSSIEGSHIDGEPVSYVTTLWPIFRLIVSQDRGDRFPRGVRYTAIELARGGQVAVDDLARLDQWFALHIHQSD